MMRRALVCGVSGQDGAYLAQLLLAKQYEVVGTSRDAESADFQALHRLGIREAVSCCSMTPTDFGSVLHVLERVRPDEIYYLAGPSSVSLSFDQPSETLESITQGTLNLLEAIRTVDPKIRLFNAASSECFGQISPENPATESTAFQPRSPYGVAKAAAFWLVANYRATFGIFVCSGLMFNHESPLRASHFATKKITSTIARIAAGRPERLALGRLDVVRDWGWAPDYVEAMWMMLQAPEPRDFVIATGQSCPLQAFVEEGFSYVNLDWREHVDVDARFFRPNEILSSYADCTRAQHELGWMPKVLMPELVRRLLDTELKDNGAQTPARSCL